MGFSMTIKVLYIILLVSALALISVAAHPHEEWDPALYDDEAAENQDQDLESISKRSAYGLMGIGSARAVGTHKTRNQLKHDPPPPETFVSVKGRKRSHRVILEVLPRHSIWLERED